MSEIRRARLRSGGVQAIAHTLRPELGEGAEPIAAVVADILEDVRARGDDALVDHARRFECSDLTHDRLRVPAVALEAAAERLPDDLRTAIVAAASQVRTLAEALMPADDLITLQFGQRVRVRTIPLEAAGCYVPGGRAAYPSSLVMTAVPAQVAGVERVVAVSPAGADGRPSEVVMGAAALLGVNEMYATGGAAAVGALAYGTATVAPVAVIAGPGSPWVQEAKRQVVGEVAIDGCAAGPSEVMVIADESADPVAVALDLLAQAEHGPDSVAVLASDDPEVVAAVGDALAAEAPPIGQVTLVECASRPLALELAEAFAPEHLELVTRDAEELAGEVTCSGSVFVGPNAATAFGDYVAGSNHVLPTGGAARHASGLGPAAFVRRMLVVEMTDEAVDALTPHLVVLADAEGYPLHRRSAEARRRT